MSFIASVMFYRVVFYLLRVVPAHRIVPRPAELILAGVVEPSQASRKCNRVMLTPSARGGLRPPNGWICRYLHQIGKLESRDPVYFLGLVGVTLLPLVGGMFNDSK